jgi:SAM-dependent methyltransferase
MSDGHNGTWADATLRRPAVDPSIPAAARRLLTAPGAMLTPASRGRQRPRRDYLPAQPDRREATVCGAVTGMTAAAFIAITGAVPWAVGVLIFQGPAGWQSASGHVALVLAEFIAIVTAVVFGLRVVRFGQLTGQAPAAVAARAYRGRYLTGTDFDASARMLLRRAQDAVDAANSSRVSRASLLDESGGSSALAWQEWDIAVTLREQTRLRGLRASLPELGAGTSAARLLQRQHEAAVAAERSVAERVSALERYAEEVREADAAHRDWEQHAVVAELTGQHLDLLARTAADEHGVTELEAVSARARAVRQALREIAD